VSPLPCPLNIAALLLAFCLPGFSQQVDGLVSMPRDGQTFLTWNEIPISGTSYRVYRSPVPITNEAQLQAADKLGDVDDLSSWNQRRSIAEEANHNWSIVSGAPELTDTTGLFVAAIEVTGNSWFAVTTLLGGTEDRILVPGENTTTSPTQEIPAPVEAVLQAATSATEIWSHWTSDRDTLHTQHQSLWPSRGHNFRVSRGSDLGPHGLLLRLHAKGGHYFSAWPHYPEVPEDVDILSLDGPVRGPEPSRKWYTVFSFGARESFPAPPTSGEVVDTFALRRAFWSLDWTQEYLGSATDSGRVYLAGGSAGAMGSMILASEHPNRFAAILCRKGLFDFTAQDIQNSGYPEELFGPISWNLYTDTGMPVFERLDATTVSQFNPSAKWPFIRTINGRNDPVVGWASTWNLFEGLSTASRPACHYFDESHHGPDGFWVDNLQDELVRRTFNHRSDLPSLRFSDFTLDSDPGDGDPTQGTLIGNLGGSVEFNPNSCTENAGQLVFDVSLRAEGAADDASQSGSRVRLTPRPAGDFQPGPGEFLRYTLRDTGELVDEHLLFPDSRGLFTTPPAPILTRSRKARFHITTLPQLPTLFVGDSPMVGEKAQAVVFGEVDELWTLAWSFNEGWWNTPWGIFELGAPWTIARTGRVGEMGVSSFFLDIQNLPWLAGRTVHFQALVDDTLTDAVTVTLR
jgi:hypothetical protein